MMRRVGKCPCCGATKELEQLVTKSGNFGCLSYCDECREIFRLAGEGDKIATAKLYGMVDEYRAIAKIEGAGNEPAT